jgi:yeast amino acid transporter
MHRKKLTGNLKKFQRWPQKKGFSSWGSSLQPGLAYFGLIACLFIVLVVNSASLWNGQQSVYKALTVYLGVSEKPFPYFSIL